MNHEQTIHIMCFAAIRGSWLSSLPTPQRMKITVYQRGPNQLYEKCFYFLLNIQFDYLIMFHHTLSNLAICFQIISFFLFCSLLKNSDRSDGNSFSNRPSVQRLSWLKCHICNKNTGIQSKYDKLVTACLIHIQL